MDVTLKNGKHFIITLRAWDGANCLPDCAGDVLATWQPETQADIDWLEHCPTCQEVSLDVQEVQE